MKHNEIEIIPLSDSALTRIEKDMTKMFGVPEDRRKSHNWSWQMCSSDGRRITDFASDGDFGRIIQLATFLSYAVHAGNMVDAKTLSKAYDEELDRVLGRSEIKGDIWRG